MKKFKKIIATTLVATTLATGTANAKGLVPKIKVVHDTGSASFWKQIKNRKGTIIISWATGTVMNSKGKVKMDVESIYDSMTYEASNVHKGDKILSISVWNPDNNFVDDIVDSCEFIIDCNHSKGTAGTSKKK